MRDLNTLLSRFFLAVGLGLVTSAAFADTVYQDAVKARIENKYMIVLFADGSKKMVPVASLNDDDRALLTKLSVDQPLPAGKSTITVVASTGPIKSTIVTATTVGPVETVQLCPPSVSRDQIGPTCMLYGRVHWLDIAGYYISNETLAKTPTGANPEQPWEDPRYLQGLEELFTGFKPQPTVMDLPGHELDPFAWARDQLRKGRPILAALPREIWQALPPGFIATHRWGGGRIGHQIVLNGFTWNSETKQGTFHVVNSWANLPEFELSTEAAKGGNLVIEQALLRKGESAPPPVRETVKAITLVRAVGKSNLYEVETNLGKRRVMAASEGAARSMAENGK
jgi:hypothetical protein